MQPTSAGDANQNNYHHQQQQQWAQQYQQQWMGMQMQYPAAAMAMQPQMMMMYPQSYMPYSHPHHFQQQQQQKLGPNEDIQTIWVGDLHPWMDENYLHSCFAHTAEVTSTKVIRNKQTGQSEGYGFIEFFSRETAEKVLQSYNGTVMPNTEQPFRMNWATFSKGDRTSDAGSDLSIFVGDLASDVTDTLLQETFASKYPSVKGAKVVIDPNSGRSKGYGFVRFGDENERSRALTEMNGTYCSSRPMRTGVATPKKSTGYQLSSSQASQGSQADGNSTNTTIFVGGIDSDVSDEDLRQPFSQFGEVVSVKIPPGKGCGFVQFANRSSAEEALQKLNGIVIGKQTVRLSWGRNPGNKQQWRTDSNNQWTGAYHGQQGYGGYEYATPTNQNNGMHAAAAAAFGAS